MILSPHSLTFLPGLRPQLVDVLKHAADITPPSITWTIIEGLRTAETQFKLWRDCHNVDGSRNNAPWKTNCNGWPIGVMTPHGVRGTGESNHQHGQAIDFCVIVGGKAEWNDLGLYRSVGGILKRAGADLKIPVVYGGDWPAPKTDSDHFQLDDTYFKF